MPSTCSTECSTLSLSTGRMSDHRSRGARGLDRRRLVCCCQIPDDPFNRQLVLFDCSFYTYDFLYMSSTGHNPSSVHLVRRRRHCPSLPPGFSVASVSVVRSITEKCLLHEVRPVVVVFTIKCLYAKHLDEALEEADNEDLKASIDNCCLLAICGICCGGNGLLWWKVEFYGRESCHGVCDGLLCVEAESMMEV